MSIRRLASYTQKYNGSGKSPLKNFYKYSIAGFTAVGFFEGVNFSLIKPSDLQKYADIARQQGDTSLAETLEGVKNRRENKNGTSKNIDQLASVTLLTLAGFIFGATLPVSIPASLYYVFTH